MFKKLDGSYTDFLSFYLSEYNIDFEEINYAACAASDHIVSNDYHNSGQEIPPYAIWRMLDFDPLAARRPISVLLFKDMILFLTTAEISLLRSLLIRYNPWEEKTYDVKLERKKITSKLRFQILARDNFTCRSCGAKPRADTNDVVLRVDHTIPVSKGGLTQVDNLQTLCDKCNNGKGDALVENLVEDNLLYQPPKDAYHPYAKRIDEFVQVTKPLTKWQDVIRAIISLFFNK